MWVEGENPCWSTGKGDRLSAAEVACLENEAMDKGGCRDGCRSLLQPAKEPISCRASPNQAGNLLEPAPSLSPRDEAQRRALGASRPPLLIRLAVF